MAPLELFAACVAYLEANWWVRDDDDPGIWLPPPRRRKGNFTFGRALELQLERDGVRYWTKQP